MGYWGKKRGEPTHSLEVWDLVAAHLVVKLLVDSCDMMIHHDSGRDGSRTDESRIDAGPPPHPTTIESSLRS